MMVIVKSFFDSMCLKHYKISKCFNVLKYFLLQNIFWSEIRKSRLKLKKSLVMYKSVCENKI